MSFQNLEINIGSVVLGDRSLNNGQYGEKKSVKKVNFDVPFSGVPKVSLGINFLDSSISENSTRVRAMAENITNQGFDCIFITWEGNTVYDMQVDYVAIFNPRVINTTNNNNRNSNNRNQSQQLDLNDDERYNQSFENMGINEYNNNNNQNRQQQQNESQQHQQTSNQFSNKELNIKSIKHNQYIRDNQGICDLSQTARNNETWIISPANNGLYLIHNKYNHYLSPQGNEKVLATERNDSSLWRIQERRSGVYSIQNAKTGNYLSATDRGKVMTNVKQVNSWEEFQFIL